MITSLMRCGVYYSLCGYAKFIVRSNKSPARGLSYIELELTRDRLRSSSFVRSFDFVRSFVRFRSLR